MNLINKMNPANKKVIMLVDDNMVNLKIGREILKEKYKVYSIPSAKIIFSLLASVRPDMILLDIEMPDMDGFEVIKRLKTIPEYADIPVIFVTARSGEHDEHEGLSLGAIDYIYKPFSPSLLLQRIENHMLMIDQNKQLKELNNNLEEKIQARTNQVYELQDAMLYTLAELIEFRDDVTGGHICRTKGYLELFIPAVMREEIFAEETKHWNVKNILQSSQLHDIGKIAISDTILNKPGKLTQEEFEIMKTHTTVGVEAINRIAQKVEANDFLKYAGLIAISHHEKWDGSGYPYGLAGEDIPLIGRIMAFADVYDALVSERPYKKPMSAEEARDIIVDGRGTHFDPRLVDVFDRVFDGLGRQGREIVRQNIRMIA
ncbi:MAG: response regulator [Clostridiales Family XIII bacterium]|jgi:putative two-component system response regulator|nr:response regulator [Clostridiales Family XIII bacterium]